jgi:ABC-type sugar transport system permease subunit
MAGIDGPNWLRQPGTAMVAVIVVQVFKNVGLNMILFLAALQGVPRELYEAAQVDGVSRGKQFRRITLPMIAPTVLLTSIITIVGSLQVFAQIAVLTQGGPGHLDDRAGLLPLPAGLPVPQIRLRLDARGPAVPDRRRADLRAVADAPEVRVP